MLTIGWYEAKSSLWFVWTAKTRKHKHWILLPPLTLACARNQIFTSLWNHPCKNPLGLKQWCGNPLVVLVWFYLICDFGLLGCMQISQFRIDCISICRELGLWLCWGDSYPQTNDSDYQRHNPSCHLFQQPAIFTCIAKVGQRTFMNL